MVSVQNDSQSERKEEATHLVQKLRPILPRKKRKGQEDLEDLKQEVEMDEHKVPLAEIYARLVGVGGGRGGVLDELKHLPTHLI